MADNSEELQGWLDRLGQGDPKAREHLLAAAWDRLSLLVRRMLRGYPGLVRWVDASDVRNEVAFRLDAALKAVTPPTVCDFLRLAAAHIRWTCIDLKRKLYGPEGEAAKHATPQANGQFADVHHPPEARDHAADDPADLLAWTEFHERIDALPDEEQRLFDLLWYQGLSQTEAAPLLGISLSTLKRDWVALKLRIRQALDGNLPK